MGWAKMLKRVFDIDIQICSKCGGQIKIISSIQDSKVIKRILSHLGESSTVPELSPPEGLRKQNMTIWNQLGPNINNLLAEHQ